jgi:hypothetical protein
VSLFVEIFGWAGAAALLTAFYINSRNIYPATSKISLWINVFGASGLLTNGIYHGALPSVGLNAVWIFVGASALIKLFRGEKNELNS